MNSSAKQHRLEVWRIEGPMRGLGRPSPGVLANVYRTDSYAVVNVGLPRCLPEKIRITVGLNGLVIEADLHPAQQKLEQDREYLLAELPFGKISRRLPLPWDDLELHAVEAHFQNGLLTITIPTRERDAFLHEMRGEQLSEEMQERSAGSGRKAP